MILQSMNPKPFPSNPPRSPPPPYLRNFSLSVPLFLISNLTPPYPTLNSLPPPLLTSTPPTLRGHLPAKKTPLWFWNLPLHRYSSTWFLKDVPVTRHLLTYNSITVSLVSPLYHESYTLHPPFLYNKNKNILQQKYPIS